jgi:hypothetical protein
MKADENDRDSNVHPRAVWGGEVKLVADQANAKQPN